MNHDALLMLLRRIVLAGGPLVAGSCSTSSYECNQIEMYRTIPVSSLGASEDGGQFDGGISDFIARCQASATDCGDLCRVALGPDNFVMLRRCELATTDAGEQVVQISYANYCLGGRRPGGLLPCSPEGQTSAVARWLAEATRMEAASIVAFEILETELRAHGAPAALVAAAREAARDEHRHTRVMGRLAVRHGARPAAVRIARSPVVRTLETVARENAVEGCARETFAALVACRQARAANDPDLRRAMHRIAIDEIRHATLSWAVNHWSCDRLPRAARRRVQDARREATEALVAQTEVTPATALRETAGLPGPEWASLTITALRNQAA